jgi:hypothetical protein
MKKTLLILGIASSTIPCLAEDVLLLKNGEKRPGEIIEGDGKFIRMRVPLRRDNSMTPVVDVIPMATVSIPVIDIDSIEFSPDPVRDAALRNATPATLGQIEAYWKKAQPWLTTPRSPSGEIACVLGDLLLATKEPVNAQHALDLFELIEKEAWSAPDKSRAKQGRLRAMVAIGRAAEAIDQAKALAAETEDPEILIEANHIIAQSAEKDFLKFLEENPRWKEDALVIDERHRLYNHVLTLYLYPALFYGTENEKAARGLWGASGIYEASGETNLAIETSRDIVTFYPDTSYARLAADYLKTLTPEQLAFDTEAIARQEQEDAAAAAEEAPSPSTPTEPTEDSVKKTKPKKKPWKKEQ